MADITKPASKWQLLFAAVPAFIAGLIVAGTLSIKKGARRGTRA